MDGKLFLNRITVFSWAYARHPSFSNPKSRLIKEKIRPCPQGTKKPMFTRSEWYVDLNSPVCMHMLNLPTLDDASKHT